MVQNNRETSITVRCDFALKEMAEASAREKGQSLVEWIRRAMMEQIKRDKSQSMSEISDDELEPRIRKVVSNMLAENGMLGYGKRI